MAEATFDWPDTSLTEVRLTFDGPRPYIEGAPWEGKEGWVQFAAKVICAKCLEAREGLPLMAEWIDGSAMHRIYPDPAGNGGWVQLSVTEGEGAAFLRQEQRVLGNKTPDNAALLYHIYWQDHGDGAIDRAFDMFAGFDAQGKNNGC